LINNPEISDTIMPPKKIVEFDNEDNIILVKEIKNRDVRTIAEIILKLLSDMDFSYTITLFHFLSEKYNNYIFEEMPGETVSYAWTCRKIICLYEMVKSVSKYKVRGEKNSCKLKVKSVLVELITQFEKEFRYSLMFLRGGRELSQIVKMILEEWLDAIKFETTQSDNPYWYRIFFYNMLAESLGNEMFNYGTLVPLSEVENDYKDLFRVNSLDYKRISLITAIDKYNLWRNEISTNVKKYIKKELEKLLKEIICDDKDEVNISCFKDGLINFKDSYKGKRNTLAQNLENDIKNLLTDRGDFEVEFSKFIALENLISAFASSGARYGKENAYEMLKDLQNAKLISITNQIKRGAKEEDKEKEHKYFIKKLYAYIHMYARCTYNEEENMIWISKEISAFKNDIYDCSMISERNKIKSVYDLLVQDVDEEVVSKFEELFP